ncbi:vWA domain-containing protein [Nakamurella lactea]|uniref:vWA domain-containing protein n=1 Tax=Nakamurella lactea TaxID=459515 RepID=UPI00041376F1|nr:VWA domain-containing protein [Nakamurella lactea]
MSGRGPATGSPPGPAAPPGLTAPTGLTTPPVLPSLVAFTRRLAMAGVPVGTDRTATFLSAVRELGTEPLQVYWAGRLTLLGCVDDIDVYDKVFAICYGRGGAPLPLLGTPPQPQLTLLDAAETDGAGPQDEAQVAPVRGRASASEVLRQKDFAALSGRERQELSAMLALLRPGLPQRATRRRRPHHRGPIDRRRTTAAIIAAAGEPVKPLRQRRFRRPRRIVLLIDVSGSMEPYADALLRFGHVLIRRQPGAVEVFTIGTRLTRVTRALAIRDPQKALAAAAGVIPDFSGGTRLGETLQAFLDRWGRRGTARGAVVVVFSDGWERGDVALLDEGARQLKMLARQLIWVNPHKAREGYQPVQGGIAAVLPHLDAFVSGHSLSALEELLQVMSNA